jgi:hypothetical protein
MKKFYAISWLIWFLFFYNITIHSQTSITGKVTDKNSGEEMIAANIVVTKNGNFIQGETTDIDGSYSIRVDAGTYDMEVSYTGYTTQQVKGVMAIKGQSTKVDIQMDAGIFDNLEWGGFYHGCLLIPIIRQDENPSILKLESERIKKLPTRNINELSSMAPGVSFAQ